MRYPRPEGFNRFVNDLNDGIQSMFFKTADDHKAGRLQALLRAGLVGIQNIPVELEHRAPT